MEKKTIIVRKKWLWSLLYSYLLVSISFVLLHLYENSWNLWASGADVQRPGVPTQLETPCFISKHYFVNLPYQEINLIKEEGVNSYKFLKSVEYTFWSWDTLAVILIAIPVSFILYWFRKFRLKLG